MSIAVQPTLLPQGHRIILPEGIAVAEALPLIIIGSRKALKLRNVTVVQAVSLAACLQLGPGAQLIAEPEDNVKLLDGADPELAESSAPEVAELASAYTVPTLIFGGNLVFGGRGLGEPPS